MARRTCIVAYWHSDRLRLPATVMLRKERQTLLSSASQNSGLKCSWSRLEVAAMHLAVQWLLEQCCSPNSLCAGRAWHKHRQGRECLSVRRSVVTSRKHVLIRVGRPAMCAYPRFMFQEVKIKILGPLYLAEPFRVHPPAAILMQGHFSRARSRGR